LVDQVERMLAA